MDSESLMTNVKGVFAIGDYTTGPHDVISVIFETHRVSAALHRYLQGDLEAKKETGVHPQTADWPPGTDSNYDALPR